MELLNWNHYIVSNIDVYCLYKKRETICYFFIFLSMDYIVNEGLLYDVCNETAGWNVYENWEFIPIVFGGLDK